MPQQDIPGSLSAVLEHDLMANFSLLDQLTRRKPHSVRVGSLSPLQALVVFEPTGPGMHHVAYVWAREPSAAEALLLSLTPGTLSGMIESTGNAYVP